MEIKDYSNYQLLLHNIQNAFNAWVLNIFMTKVNICLLIFFKIKYDNYLKKIYKIQNLRLKRLINF